MPGPRITGPHVALVASVLVLASCGHGKPTGQVVARVDGDEVTAAELRLEVVQIPSELVGAGAAQQQALQAIITRKLLVHEAQKRGLDVSPEGKALTNQAREAALMELLRAKLASDGPLDTSDAAITRFVDSHPAQFSDRKLITGDQLVISSADPALAQKLQSLPDLGAVQAYLDANNITFIRSAAVVDTAELTPEAIQRLTGMNPGGIFVAPPAGPGAGIRVLSIVSRKAAPLTGDEARDVALKLLGAGRNNAALGAMQKILDNGRSKVWIDPAFSKS